MTLKTAARLAWRRIVEFGLRALYSELAYLYDPVSWAVSRGRWRAWQATIWPHLPPEGRILEVGCGPGHLLADLRLNGYEPVGLDLSLTMVRKTARNLQRRGVATPVVRARASALPFRASSFDAVIVTFPTAFIYGRPCLDQARQTLAPGGRLVVVEAASFTSDALLPRALEWLYEVTGQRGPAPDLVDLLDEAGFSGRRTSAEVDGTQVSLVVADADSSSSPQATRTPGH